MDASTQTCQELQKLSITLNPTTSIQHRQHQHHSLPPQLTSGMRSPDAAYHGHPVSGLGQLVQQALPVRAQHMWYTLKHKILTNERKKDYAYQVRPRNQFNTLPSTRVCPQTENVTNSGGTEPQSEPPS
eukprot:1156430-Pelagomonas_calceolata.AAC.2